jgi:hypothetical protein
VAGEWRFRTSSVASDDRPRGEGNRQWPLFSLNKLMLPDEAMDFMDPRAYRVDLQPPPFKVIIFFAWTSVEHGQTWHEFCY